MACAFRLRRRQRYLGVVVLLQSCFGHVVVYSRDVSAKPGRDVGRGRQSAFQGSQHIGEREQNGPYAEVGVLGQWRLNDGSEQMADSCQMVQLDVSVGPCICLPNEPSARIPLGYTTLAQRPARRASQPRSCIFDGHLLLPSLR